MLFGFLTVRGILPYSDHYLGKCLTRAMILIIFPRGVLLDYVNNIWLSLIVEIVAYFPVIGIKIHFF